MERLKNNNLALIDFAADDRHSKQDPLNVLQGQYSKITFRSPLYVGGSPSAYWLVRATGTNRGFVGCIQSLTINNKATDIRPWPLGKALSGADIGEGAVGGI